MGLFHIGHGYFKFYNYLTFNLEQQFYFNETYN